MATSGSAKKGLPPKILVGILLAVVVPLIAVRMSRKTGDLATPGTQSPTPDTDRFDPEPFRVPIGFLEEAVYTNAGVDRLPESAHALAAAVMAKNRTNPMVRPVVIELETRLDRLAQMGGTSPETIQAWEAIRRDYFKPAAWLHAPAIPAAR